MNISKANRFNLDNAISLINRSSNKTEELKKIEEQAKEKIKNNPVTKFEGNTSVNPPKLTITSAEGITHFDFIQDIEEFSADKKKQIRSLINESIKRPNSWAGDYYKMDGVQTSLQLQLISEKLIPEKYKEQMNQAIKAYKEEGTNYELLISKALDTAKEKLYAKFPLTREESKSSKDITTVFNERQQTINSFYNELDFSTPTKFVESFENVLAKYKDHQKNLYNSSDALLQGFQEDLRNKWNNFASKFEEMQSFKLPTNQNSLYDFSV